MPPTSRPTRASSSSPYRRWSTASRLSRSAPRLYHRSRVGRAAMVDPLAEDWQPAFSIIEDGATVHPGCHVHDSVVLKGAVVEAGASLVRSLACPGAVVRAKTTHVDQYVGCP